jgi:hypothetical protein
VAIIDAPFPACPRGGVLARIEDGRAMLTLAGVGRDNHPPTAPDGFERFAAALPWPDIAEAIAGAEPLDAPVPYRFMAGTWRRYDRLRHLPEGFVVVGDGVCSLDPVYGQGMTVAAQQAVRLRDHWGRPDLQRRLDRVADFCWSVATSEDLRHPTSAGQQNLAQRLMGAWSIELARLAVAGNERAFWTFARVYHLMIEPRALFAPALVAEVARARVRGHRPPAPRPDVLDRLRSPQPA